MYRLCHGVLLLMLVASGGFAQTDTAGTTYNRAQHYGSCGRMIGVDNEGRAHVVWMKQHTYDPAGSRHIYYNIWDPVEREFAFRIPGGATGQLVDVYARAGFACLATRPDGWCIPAFHVLGPTDSRGHTSAALDFEIGVGAFTTSQPLYRTQNGETMEIIWPKISADAEGNVHMLSVESQPVGQPGGPQRLYYSKGQPLFDEDGYGIRVEWQTFDGYQLVELDTTNTLAHNIAASRTGERIACAWLRPPVFGSPEEPDYNCDIFLRSSEDGGNTWGGSENLTNFVQPDSECLATTGNERCCDRDTIRAYHDLSMVFGNSNFLHVAFVTVGYYHFPEGENYDRLQRHKAQIWHWSENHPQPALIAEFWIPDSAATPQLNSETAIIEHAGLSLDRNGILYCTYLKYDTAVVSEFGYPNADVFVSVSTNGGVNWSVGTNVTNTTPEQIPAPLGTNLSEQDVSASELIARDSLHLFYLLDRDCVMNTDLPSLNAMIYRRVAANSIPTQPLMPERDFHVTINPCDTADAINDLPVLATSTRLYPAYPNPFNSATTIRFELPSEMRIRIAVYNVLGQMVDIAAEGKWAAGTHNIPWDARGLASGIYFISLEHSGFKTAQKVMLLR